jgi:N-acetylglucosamine kinase-like BadF-type ATPase
MQYEPLVTLPAALRGPATGVSGVNGGPGTRFLMGVDGGATKTLAAVLDLQERCLYLGHGASSNPDAVGPHVATDSLMKATDEAIARAGIERDRLDAAVLAVAGTDTDAVAAHVRTLRPSSWVIVNDVVGAWAAATGARPGVGAISGTGSNVFGVGADGRAWRAGGWGHVLGDEGSGYWLAVQSIKAALRDRERSGSETALSDAATDFFDVPTVEAVATLVYSKPLSKGEIAAFAIETARVAQAGDEVARGLYEHAATELGKQVEAVIAQTGLAGAFPVGLIGSAFKAGGLFVEPLAAAIHKFAPEASVAVVEMAPVGGCLLLATRLAGCEHALDQAQLKPLLDAVLAREGVFRE